MSKNRSAVRPAEVAAELEILPATALRLNTRDVMERVKFRGEHFLIETFGQPMVVLISYEDYLYVRKYLPQVSTELPGPPGPSAANSDTDSSLL